jgi:hypothetical protein
MKAIFTFLALPVIVLICFFSGQFYISGEYVLAYTLVLASFFAISFWIHYVSLPLQNMEPDMSEA